jgi:hypothetical protein
MPAGLVKLTSVACGASAHIAGDVEHNRHRAQRLGKAAHASGFLADQVVAPAKQLVAVARGLPAHPQLRDHEIGPVDRPAAVAGQLDFEWCVGECGHALRERADHRQPLLVRVDQPDLLQPQHTSAADEPIDQLGCIGAAATNDYDFHMEPLCFSRNCIARCRVPSATI